MRFNTAFSWTLPLQRTGHWASQTTSQWSCEYDTVFAQGIQLCAFGWDASLDESSWIVVRLTTSKLAILSLSVALDWWRKLTTSSPRTPFGTFSSCRPWSRIPQKIHLSANQRSVQSLFPITDTWWCWRFGGVPVTGGCANYAKVLQPSIDDVWRYVLARTAVTSKHD